MKMTLIEKLREQQEKILLSRKDKMDEWYKGYLSGIEYSIETYEENNAWIPASEPPKENGAYMATIVRIADNHKYSEELVYCKFVNEWYWDDEEESIVDDGFVVIAWQPLPKPYGGK